MREKVTFASGILRFARVSGGQKTSKNHLGSTFFRTPPKTSNKLRKKHKKGAKKDPKREPETWKKDLQKHTRKTTPKRHPKRPLKNPPTSPPRRPPVTFSPWKPPLGWLRPPQRVNKQRPALLLRRKSASRHPPMSVWDRPGPIFCYSPLRTSPLDTREAALAMNATVRRSSTSSTSASRHPPIPGAPGGHQACEMILGFQRSKSIPEVTAPNHVPLNTQAALARYRRHVA